MRLSTDSRAQSIQIGAVLLFGVLVVLLALYQAFVVPNQNEEIEFDHNQQLQGQLTELRSTAVSMPGETTRKSVSVNMGVRYPARTIFVNPGPSSGVLETVPPSSGNTAVTIENAGVVGEHRGVASFWNATDPVYETKAIEYRPTYNHYTEAPRTVYEHGTLYNEFERNGATLPVTGQALIDDTRLSLVALNGSLRENRADSASVAFEPVSTRTETVLVSGQGGENITLQLPSRLSNEGWNETLADETNAWVVENGNDDIVEIELADAVYELQLGKVGVGTGITGTDPAYVALVEGHRGVVDRGRTHAVTVEVRDKYNGPQRGVTVEATAVAGAIEDPEQQTDRNGRATFEFNSTGVFVPDDERDVELTFEAEEGTFIENGSSTVNTTVTVRDTADIDIPEPVFGAFWNVSGFDAAFQTDCEEGVDACILVGTTNATMAFETDPETAAGFVDFALDNRTVGEVTPYSGAFDDGATEFDVGFDAEELGVTDVTLFAGGDRDTVTIEVFGTGTLTGAVTNAADGEPIEGVTVTVEETDDSATTDATGEYEIEDVPAGTVTVTADAEGYQAETREDVKIETGETTEENFELESVDGFDVTITGTNQPVTERETLTVTAEVRNTGDEADTQDVTLEIDGVGVVDTVTVENLGPGGVQTVTLAWETGPGDAGEYTATVSSDDDSDREVVTVEDSDSIAFETLTYETGSGNLNQVDIVWENRGSAVDEIEFTATDSQGDTDSTVVEPVFGAEEDIRLNTGGNPDWVDVEAVVRDGDGNIIEVCQGRIENTNTVISLGDGIECG